MGRRSRARLALIALAGAALVAGVAAPPPARSAEAARDVAALIAGMEDAYAALRDYTARFSKREVVAGRRRPLEEALLKFQRPGRIYLRWTSGPAKGREILFVPGRDGDLALVHEPGLISGRFTILMPPDHGRVLAESRHPITDVGLGRLVELIALNARRGLAAGEVQLVDRGRDGDGRRIELSFPPGRAGVYYCRRLVATLRGGLPVVAAIHDFDERLVAEYAYEDVRPNPGLGEADFDPGNPGYGFPRIRLAL